MDRESFFNSSVSKNKVKLSSSFKTSITTRSSSKPWTCLALKPCLKNGQLDSIFIFRLIFSSNTQNSLRTLKLSSWHLLNFSLRLFNCLASRKIIWKKKATGKIGPDKNSRKISLLSWDDQRNTQRKRLLKKAKTIKSKSKTSGLQTTSIFLPLARLSQNSFRSQHKWEPTYAKNWPWNKK